MDPITAQHGFLAEAASLLPFSKGQIHHPALSCLFLECRRERSPPSGHPPTPPGLDNSPPTCRSTAMTSHQCPPCHTTTANQPLSPCWHSKRSQPGNAWSG